MNIKNHATFSVRYEIIRSGGTYALMQPYDTPEIQYIASSELKMSIKGTFYVPDVSVNFLSDRLRVVVIINGTEYPCGMFCVTSETREKDGGKHIATIEGYSLLYLAKRKKIEDRLHISAGTNYITQINALLISAGISSIQSTSTSLTFASDREDWEIGTDVITIVNALLDEINYNSAWVDLDGVTHLTKYAAPSAANVAHTYVAGEFSIIGSNYKVSNDLHSKCNVFKVICSNPDLGSPMSAASVNSDSSCRFSTANIGRVLYVETVDNVPSQSALQEKADNLKAKSLLAEETAEFYTFMNPVHTAFQTIALDNGELSGLYSEIEWRMPLSASEDMIHKAKRVIT